MTLSVSPRLADKGTVENRMGGIRRLLSKGSNLRTADDQLDKKAESHINNRPVQKFEYLDLIQQTLKHRAVALIT